MMANGMKTLSTVKELRHGRMAQFTTDNTTSETNMVKVSLIGLMAVISKEISRIIKSRATVFIPGPTAGSSQDTGLTTRWMAKAYSPGKMAENMKENTRMTRNMDTEFSSGQMAANTKANGSTANSMAKDSTHPPLAR